MMAKPAARMQVSGSAPARYASADAAMADAEKGGYGPVPVHLRDTHYAGHDRIGSGDGYKYPHDYPNHYVEQQYLPDDLVGKHYYEPAPNKTEQAAAAYWREIKKKG